MTTVHAAAWPLVALGLAGIAAAATVAAVLERWPPLLDVVRRIALVVLVAEAAIGLALAVRGTGPAELLHWVYGAAVVGVLLVPAALPEGTAPRLRSWSLAAGAVIAAVLVWRLWASG